MSELNAEQQLAVQCKDKHILCLAGAGTGKTFTMLERISKLVKDGTDPNYILVLTFTNAAALEMKVRYRIKHKDEICPEFRTFHSFCYNLIVQDKDVRQKLNYNKIPNIASDGAIRRIREEVQKQTGIKVSKDKLRGNVPLTGKDKTNIEILKKAEMKMIRSKNLITFDMLCYDVCKLFEDDDPSIVKYKKKYKHIFVDEFQDTDMKQWNFVKSFTDSCLFLVGDALQAIYAFRGATSQIIKQLAEDKDWTTIKLNTNYRCRKKICDFANDLSNYADEDYRVNMVAPQEGGEVHIHEYSSYYGGRCDIDTLNFCLSSSSWEGSTAILCRTNREVSFIQYKFKENGLSYSAGKKQQIANNMIRSVRSEEFCLEWLASLLSTSEYTKFVRKAHSVKTKGSRYLSSDLVRDFKYRDDIEQYYKSIKWISSKLESDLDPLGKWVEIFKTLGVKCPFLPDGVETSDEIYATVCGMLESDNIDESGVYIGTIHSVKGLEYDNVLVLGVNSKTFPINSEDDYNLYYVAVTRARNSLDIFRG